jgi:hypothetical protein
MLQLSERVMSLFDGQAMDGGWLSTTVTVKVHEAEAWLFAVTRYVTGVDPTLNVEPLAGPETLDNAKPGQLSLAEGTRYVA